MKKSTPPAVKTVKGYKVFNPDFACNGFQYAENSEFTFKGQIIICSAGFHFCEKASHCFSYYGFDSNNIVCEVEARGNIMDHPDDSKHCTDKIFIGRKLSWQEVLVAANEGSNNTGHSNSGNWNSGDRNSGNWNSGNWNSGNRNSGDRNSGNWNSGDRNSGNWNSGNWNSGDRNSGDSNSGYRNSGAFCNDNDPVLFLFNKPTDIKVRNWENHRAVRLMYNIDPTLWVPAGMMTDEEKAANPKYETTEGYLKSIPYKEAWSNMWHNLSDDDKSVFLELPNFDLAIFEDITGIKITK